ncbi:pilus assembly protein TadG-related protein, partial [Acidimangrovimonas sediminis]|uniref:pilus assembly protein TadG-related protein n=1 Tax=Acidimangrovimonas sediminis TaxID=2056283 RepID=UPI0018EBC320
MFVFGLLMLTGMLVVSGMSIDVLRYEMLRSRLQNTLDAATLAAANLDQTQDPTSVVLDYMDKAGLGDYITASDVTVTSSINARTVTATASGQVNSIFMSMLGVDTLDPSANSTAKEAIGNVEISLVLDVSGSMNTSDKIGNLKTAATQFVSKMFNTVDPGKLSISIIPYAAQVTAGPELFSYFNTTKDHDYSYCVDFSSSDFTQTAIALTEKIQQAANWDPWGTSYHSPWLDPGSSWRVCPLESSRYILPFSGTQSTLDSMIDGLKAGGNTSIDVGMKWGVALLDPAAQPIVSDMINKG